MNGSLLKEVETGDSFFAGMGHKLPFDGKLDRVARIAELIVKHGRVPIRV